MNIELEQLKAKVEKQEKQIQQLLRFIEAQRKFNTEQQRKNSMFMGV